MLWYRSCLHALGKNNAMLSLISAQQNAKEKTSNHVKWSLTKLQRSEELKMRLLRQSELLLLLMLRLNGTARTKPAELS